VDAAFANKEKVFCCQGCLFVHELLTQNGLEQFYELNRHPGVRVRSSPAKKSWEFLDEPALQAKLLDFTDGKTSRITFHIPTIHCVACVWLLENLFRLLPGIGKSQVNFPRREVAISFAAGRAQLSQLVALLLSIGYEPELNLAQLEKPKTNSIRKKQWLQIGLAGFAFGNIMLFSLPTYLGLDNFSGPAFKTLFGYLSLALALPVLVYSASDYWRSALVSVRQRMLTLEVPIALGLAALYAQSIFEVLSGRGEGYADSLAGLVFFLLCGRAFQQKTHDRIVFDRDYRSFFPLSVVRKTEVGEESIALANLEVGDCLSLRNGELIPADSKLLTGAALIDYSFVTGESEPLGKQPGDYLYAGGQQVGGRIEVETVKPVCQSYLASLWNHEAFRKERANDLNTLTNRYSRRFTRIVIGIAAGAALFWSASGDPGRGLKAFTSVLIVACPCALALAAPFALGTAQRLLAKGQVFLKNGMVLERLSEVDAIVFDKTGTLTTPHSNEVIFHPAVPAPHRHGGVGDVADNDGPGLSSINGLTQAEATWVHLLSGHSTHPHSLRIAEALIPSEDSALGPSASISGFAETSGSGIRGTLEGHEIQLGSRTWLESLLADLPPMDLPPGSVSHLAIDGRYRGAFVFANTLRPHTDQLFAALAGRYELALLSGDNEKERARFLCLFGAHARLHFNQSPVEKLGFIQNLQESGKTVMMVGDGLNDAGALKQSDIGVAVVESIGAFSPASDIIIEAGQVPRLCRILDFARTTTRVVRASFGISALYNLLGISVGAAGILSPLICAVLMPLSSISVVLFACGMTTWAAKRTGLSPAPRRAHDSGFNESFIEGASSFHTPHSALRT
jgi:Cu+-exporting ATPase